MTLKFNGRTQKNGDGKRFTKEFICVHALPKDTDNREVKAWVGQEPGGGHKWGRGRGKEREERDICNSLNNKERSTNTGRNRTR